MNRSDAFFLDKQYIRHVARVTLEDLCYLLHLLCKAKGLEKKPSVVEEEVLVTRWEYENKMIESRCSFLRGRVG
jgi:hypothetical protein